MINISTHTYSHTLFFPPGCCSPFHIALVCTCEGLKIQYLSGGAYKEHSWGPVYYIMETEGRMEGERQSERDFFSWGWRYPRPLFTISDEKSIFFSLTTTHTQAHHKDKKHSNQSFEYPLCFKRGKWLMHIWIKVQLKVAALSYGCYSSIRSWNTPFQREKKEGNTQSFLHYFHIFLWMDTEELSGYF